MARRSNIGSNTRQISTPSKARKCSRKRVATAAQRRRQALKLLASCRDGCTEAIMLAHGFTVEQMVDLRIRTPTHGYEPTREAAMAAFAKGWRRE